MNTKPVNLTLADFYTFSLATATRRHRYQLYVNHCKGVRKHFFAERVVSPWNSQPVSVGFTSLHRFKRTILKIDLL